jgi:beta-phosphoglucomutase-like phosphatase (HAD superfamily)
MRSAVVFDVDGVLVDSPHERAWREALAQLARGRWRDVVPDTSYRPDAFDTATYQRFAAGKPRLSGARAILDHFGFPAAEARALVYAGEKQRRFRELIGEGAFEPFPDALRLVTELRRQDVRLAAASSSKNANDMMKQIAVRARPATAHAPRRLVKGTTLVDCFAANVCGVDVDKGKPAPDLFLLAAAALAVDPADCVVVEDAPAGVAAAKNGGMKAIGIARLHDEAMLSASGADLVVNSLDQVAVNPLLAGTLAVRRS